MYTVRGFVRSRDGEIHTDSKTKLITVLLYMNEGWESDGGRLRILRSGTDLEDSVAEVPPYGGRCWCSSARTIRGTATSRMKALAARSS